VIDMADAHIPPSENVPNANADGVPPAGAVQNPPPTPPPHSPKKWREPWLIGVLVASITSIGISALLSWVMNHPSTHTPKIGDPDLAQMLFDDTAEFHRMYWGWTIVDWVLTFFAAGTAVAATMKNTYSVQQGQAEPSWLDKTLMVLAILAVLASTFDAKLHASQLAVENRLGDLTMQRAEMQWAYSAKGDPDKKAFLDQWGKAEDFLQPSTINITPAPAPGGTPNTPNPNSGGATTPQTTTTTAGK
jgi:hypothetical protein